MPCPDCGSSSIQKAGSIIATRGRVQRFRCKECGKKFHESLLAKTPDPGRVGYLDIETSQAGRGAGNFGVMYSWAVKPEGKKVRSMAIRERSLAAEKDLVSGLMDELDRYDTIVTYYGTRHDIPIMRTRALFHGLAFPPYMGLYHVDLYYVARYRLQLHSNRLEAVAKFFGIEGKTPLDPETWVAAGFGDMKAMRKILIHNEGDVIVLEEVHRKLEAYMRPMRRSV